MHRERGPLRGPLAFLLNLWYKYSVKSSKKADGAKAAKKPKNVYIYGKHALREALTERPQIIERAFVSPHVDAPEILNLLKKNRIQTGTLNESGATRDILEEASHQGLVAQIDPEKLMIPFESWFATLNVNNHTGIVLLDEVHDPQNVGSVIRSAAAFGIAAILMPEHNQAQVTGAVVKVSAGMAFRMPLVRIGNVNQTVRALKEKGFWVYGLDMKGQPVEKESFEKPSLFILGNEAKGIREKTLELCDIPLSIPMNPRAESLNAATAAAIVMHQWSVKNPGALA